MIWRFANPEWFLLLFFPIILIGLFLKRRPKVPISSLARLENLSSQNIFSIPWRHFPIVLRMLMFVSLIIALARPQSGYEKTTRKSEGIDIMTVIDTSGSMRALDFEINGQRLNRLTIIKELFKNFVKNRFGDRIGLVVFGTEVFTQAPLTIEHETLVAFLDQVNIGVAGENTAIGDAIGIASQRLTHAEGKSKIIIILTDGENTAGKLTPNLAARAAKKLGIKIYTIGVGSKGIVPIRDEQGFLHRVKFNLDETTLKHVAKITGGRYYRATDTESLSSIYEAINQLEKTEIEIEVFFDYNDYFPIFIGIALFLFFIELLFLTTHKRGIA